MWSVGLSLPYRTKVSTRVSGACHSDRTSFLAFAAVIRRVHVLDIIRKNIFFGFIHLFYSIIDQLYHIIDRIYG